MRQVDVFQKAALTFQSLRVFVRVGVMYVCVYLYGGWRCVEGGREHYKENLAAAACTRCCQL